MLDTTLTATANLDLGAVFTALGRSFTDADLGEARFNASAVLELVANAAPPDLAGVLAATATASATLRVRIDSGLPGGQVTGEVERLRTLVTGLGPVLPPVDLAAETGLDAVLARTGAVGEVLGKSPFGVLFGLVPGLTLPATVGRVGGTVGGLVELARVVAGLPATATVSDRLVQRAALLAGRLDVAAARAAADRVGRLAADTALVAALRTADPDDPDAVEALGRRVVSFLDAMLEMEQRWAIGMGVGEAALVGLDLAGGAAGLELARLALSGADLTAVAALAADLRALADPILRVPLPVPADDARDVVDQALDLLEGLVATVRAWDPESTREPVQRIGDLALEPLRQVQRAVEAVAGTVSSAIGALGGLVAEVDLRSVADAVTRALQPVIDTLDAVEDAVGVAADVLEQVCANLATGLGAVADEVTAGATTVRDALGRVRTALQQLKLAELAETLRTRLGAVAAALGSAQLAPYFDTAIEVIDAGTDVIDAVPFELLPTDVQQEVVDLGKPIKQLDLQQVEDVLRAELAAIRTSLRADALDAIEQAYAAVVAALAALDPQPGLAALESGPLEQLRAAVAAVDPVSLLAPAAEALGSLQGLLDGVDLRAAVLGPLDGLFTPVVDALAGLDPAQALRPVQNALDEARQAVLEALNLDDVTAAVTGFRDRVAQGLRQADPAALAAVLDAEVAARIGELPAGPPGGPFGSLLVTVGQASGLDVTEPAVADALAWVGGRTDGAAVVRARLRHVADRVDGVRADVAGLDPAPVTAAAAAQHRALRGALAGHGPATRLRLALDPLLAGTGPADVLGPLAENRRRYLLALELDAVFADTLAASGRSEVTAAAAGVHAALLPLAAIPARARALLEALGIATDGSLRDLVARLYALAGPARLLPPLTELLTVGRDKLLGLLDVLLAPVLDAVAAVRGVLDALDVGPVVAELTGLHQQVLGQVQAVAPQQLLGGVLAAADEVVARLRDFDPLAPVAGAVTAAREAALTVLETARPTVVFADVVGLHRDVVALAAGLDVAALLRPVLEALDGLGGQLDDGFDRTGDALQRLQAALPDTVTPSVLSVGVEVGVEVGLG